MMVVEGDSLQELGMMKDGQPPASKASIDAMFYVKMVEGDELIGSVMVQYGTISNPSFPQYLKLYATPNININHALGTAED
ncbi:hypothetical protein ACE6H2_023495 [Prunus campanulata]